MNGIDKIRKLVQERAAAIDKLATELEALKAKYQQLEGEINAAIDAGNTALAEKLVNQQREVAVKTEVAQRTIDRKAEQNKDNSELVQAANKDTAEYQKKIDQAEAEALSAKKVYLSKVLEVAVLVNSAWETRTAYCAMKDGVADPTTANAQTSEFNGVSARIMWDRKDDQLLQEINPDALVILGNATRSHFNRYAGRDEAPRIPNVQISGH